MATETTKREDFEWLTKDEVYARSQLFLNMLKQTFDMDRQDEYAGQHMGGKQKSIEELFSQLFPRIVYHHESLPQFITEKVKQKKPLLKPHTKEYDDVCFQAAIDFCSELPIHENLHQCGDLRCELPVFAMMDKLMEGFRSMRFSGWQYLLCPNKNGLAVSWAECFQCKEDERHPTCPFLAIRKDAYSPNRYEAGVYHISELAPALLRNSYYERVGEPYARDWQSFNPLLLGKALGWFIESLHPNMGEMELVLTRELCQPFVQEKLPDDFKAITAHQDLLLDASGDGYWVVELKLYAMICLMVRGNKAKPEHEQQARSYYTMGKILRPDLYNKVRKVVVTYYTKAKEDVTKIDIEVPMQPVNPVEPAVLLHKALAEKNPDLLPRCPPYMCGRIVKGKYTGYCNHMDCKHHPRHIHPDSAIAKMMRKDGDDN